MPNPIPLTRYEKCLINYHGTWSWLRWARTLARPLYVLVSLGFIVNHILTGDALWAVIGYGILLFRLAWCFWRSRRSLKGALSVIEKYQARLTELEQRDVKS